MSARARSRAGWLLALAACASAAACDSPVVQGAPAPAPTPGRAGAGARGGSASSAASSSASRNGAAADAGAGEGDAGDRPPPLPLADTDFTESDRTRDPFRSFAREFVPVGPQVQVVENTIKLREYGLDELQLIAVILGTDNPYAMVVDTTHRGTIIRRGDYVGRPDTVAAGGDGLMPHQVPWRVARITGTRVRRDADNNLTEVPAEVVFEREDRLNPAGGRAEHVLTLTPGAQATRPQDGAGSTTPSMTPLPGMGPNGSPFLPSFVPSGAGGSNGGSYVQSFTTVVPPQPAQPAPPTTVVVQTGPQGQTTVSTPGDNTTPPVAPQGPRNPYAPPPGGSNVPPPVRVTGSAPLPVSGLPSE